MKKLFKSVFYKSEKSTIEDYTQKIVSLQYITHNP